MPRRELLQGEREAFLEAVQAAGGGHGDSAQTGSSGIYLAASCRACR